MGYAAKFTKPPLYSKWFCHTPPGSEAKALLAIRAYPGESRWKHHPSPEARRQSLGTRLLHQLALGVKVGLK